MIGYLYSNYITVNDLYRLFLNRFHIFFVRYFLKIPLNYKQKHSKLDL